MYNLFPLLVISIFPFFGFAVAAAVASVCVFTTQKYVTVLPILHFFAYIPILVCCNLTSALMIEKYLGNVRNRSALLFCTRMLFLFMLLSFFWSTADIFILGFFSAKRYYMLLSAAQMLIDFTVAVSIRKARKSFTPSLETIQSLAFAAASASQSSSSGSELKPQLLPEKDSTDISTEIKIHQMSNPQKIEKLEKTHT